MNGAKRGSEVVGGRVDIDDPPGAGLYGEGDRLIGGRRRGERHHLSLWRTSPGFADRQDPAPVGELRVYQDDRRPGLRQGRTERGRPADQMNPLEVGQTVESEVFDHERVPSENQQPYRLLVGRRMAHDPGRYWFTGETDHLRDSYDRAGVSQNRLTRMRPRPRRAGC
ncbi:MAG: hypothetical protein GY713_00940 [Actinomycetia bacterium]|nr:hypothetical protein [Actinomycetes bacterium]